MFLGFYNCSNQLPASPTSREDPLAAFLEKLAKVSIDQESWHGNKSRSDETTRYLDYSVPCALHTKPTNHPISDRLQGSYSINTDLCHLLIIYRDKHSITRFILMLRQPKTPPGTSCFSPNRDVILFSDSSVSLAHLHVPMDHSWSWAE